jgi:hypothetical protein
MTIASTTKPRLIGVNVRGNAKLLDAHHFLLYNQIGPFVKGYFANISKRCYQEQISPLMESQPISNDTSSAPESVEQGNMLHPMEPIHAPSTSDRRRDARLAIGAGLAYLALFLVTQRIPFGQTAVVAATLVSLALVLLFTVTAARALNSRRALAIWATLSGILSLPYVLVPIFAIRFPTWSGWPTVGRAFLQYKYVMAHIPGLHGLMLILFAICLGVWVSHLLREMKILLPIAIVLAVMDLYVVFGGGAVTQANTGKAPMAQAAMQSLTVPLASHPKGAAPMELSVGFADFLFIALFFACFARFGVPSRRTFLTLAAVLTGYLAVVYIIKVDLPALVPIAIVVVGMNLRQFRYERSEAFALLYAGLIVAVMLGGLFYFSHH